MKLVDFFLQFLAFSKFQKLYLAREAIRYRFRLQEIENNIFWMSKYDISENVENNCLGINCTPFLEDHLKFLNTKALSNQSAFICRGKHKFL